MGLNDLDIAKGLECCQTAYDRNCDECPYKIYQTSYISASPCTAELRKDLLGFVNRKNEAIEKWKSLYDDSCESLRLACEVNKDLTAENKNQSANIRQLVANNLQQIKVIKQQNQKINLWQEEASSLGCENEWLKAHMESVESETIKWFADLIKQTHWSKAECDVLIRKTIDEILNNWERTKNNDKQKHL